MMTMRNMRIGIRRRTRVIMSVGMRMMIRMRMRMRTIVRPRRRMKAEYRRGCLFETSQ